MGWVVVLAIGYAAYSCSKAPTAVSKAQAEAAVLSDSGDPPSVAEKVAADLDPMRGDFDEDRASERAIESLSGQTYEAALGNGECTDDCSGHEAGWRTAQEGEDCTGEGSFLDGCEAFASAVEERVSAARQAYEGGDNTFAGPD